MALPAELWPSDTEAFFGEDYSASTGDWNDDVGAATKFSQGTSGNRPAEDTSTAPSGRMMLHFDGSNDQLSGGNIPTGNLATWSGSGYWVKFVIIKRDTAGSSVDEEHIVNYNGSELLAILWGQLYQSGAYGDDSPLGTGVARIIVHHDVAGNLTTLYVNGVAQSDTGSASSGIRNQWIDLKYVGNRNNGTQPFDGLIGCLGFIQRSTFGSTEIAALDAAMDEWWTTAPGGGGGEVDLTATAAGVGTSSASLATTRALSGSALGAGAAAGDMSVLRALDGSAAGLGAASASARVQRPLSGIAAGAASAAMSLGRDRGLAADATGVGSGSLSVAIARALSATALGAATSTSSLAASRTFSGASVGQSTTTATIRVTRPLAGSSAGVASSDVSLSVSSVTEVLFTGSSAGLSEASASLAVAKAFVASAIGRATTAANFVLARRFDLSAAGVAASTAELRLVLRLGGASTSGATTDATLSVVRTFAATSSGFATTSAELSDGIPATTADLSWTARPATSFVISFRPATSFEISQRPATTFTVSQAMDRLHVGDDQVIDVEIRDTEDDELADPSELTITVQSPSQGRTKPTTSTVYTYGVDSEIEKVSTGVYRATIDCTEAGPWAFSWNSPGPTAKGTVTGSFAVDPAL